MYLLVSLNGSETSLISAALWHVIFLKFGNPNRNYDSHHGIDAYFGDYNMTEFLFSVTYNNVRSALEISERVLYGKYLREESAYAEVGHRKLRMWNNC